jgi:hypothetical protein
LQRDKYTAEKADVLALTAAIDVAVGHREMIAKCNAVPNHSISVRKAINPTEGLSRHRRSLRPCLLPKRGPNFMRLPPVLGVHYC